MGVGWFLGLWESGHEEVDGADGGWGTVCVPADLCWVRGGVVGEGEGVVGDGGIACLYGDYGVKGERGAI